MNLVDGIFYGEVYENNISEYSILKQICGKKENLSRLKLDENQFNVKVNYILDSYNALDIKCIGDLLIKSFKEITTNSSKIMGWERIL